MFKLVFKRLLLIFIAVLITSCSAITPQMPSASIQSINVHQWSLSRIDLSINLTLTNPNFFDLNIADIDYRFLVAEKPIATGDINKNLQLKANSSAPLTLAIQLDLIQLLPEIPDLLLSKKLPFTLAGELTIDNYPLPVSFSKSGVVKP